MDRTDSSTAPAAGVAGLSRAWRGPGATTSRRRFLAALTMAPLAGAALSACGSSGPSTSGSSDGGGKGGKETISMWYLAGDPNETIKKDSLKTWNSDHPKESVGITFFQNDAYKTKIKTAIGAGQAPTMIYSWGGGTLRSYAQADQVIDMTSVFEGDAKFKDSVLASTYGAATVDGKIYAYPNENASLIVFYVNKDLLEKNGVQPPKTWDDLMAAVKTLNAAGVAPLALGGQSRWTSMMWLEYLFDRVGGPQVFQAIYDGKANAWSDPAAIKAMSMVQDLIKAGGFIKGFESITADSNADLALLYTGKAAMMLHGSWQYAGIKSAAPDFLPSLGWIDFPAVTGGAGDPQDVAGNPAQYMSISKSASAEQVKAATDYLKNGIMSDAVIDAYIESGQVCIASGIEDKVNASKDKDFLNYAYNAVKNAPSFVQSWDQALSPGTAEKLLSNIDQLFSLSITPEQFATSMNPTLGQ